MNKIDILEKHIFNTKPTISNESIIYLNNNLTNKKIYGNYLELVVKVEEHYLVFMTDDIPNEDMLHIHLLDKDLNILDSATIGSIYSTGSFSKYKIISPRDIEFHFIGKNTWRVKILDKKEFRLPFISSPKGVSRKHSFSQYFKVYGDPKPDN